MIIPLCRDYETILSSIEMEKANHFTPEDKDTLKKYIDECPREVKGRHPYALLVFAIHLFVHNETALFVELCREVEGYLASDESLFEPR